jgi:hypothetical protein
VDANQPDSGKRAGILPRSISSVKPRFLAISTASIVVIIDMHVKPKESPEGNTTLTKRAPRQLHLDSVANAGWSPRGSDSDNSTVFGLFDCEQTTVPCEAVLVIVAAVAGLFIVVGVYVNLNAVIMPG